MEQISLGNTKTRCGIYRRIIQPTTYATTNGEKKMKTKFKTPKILSIYDIQDVQTMLEEDMINEYEEAFMRGYMKAASS